MSTPGDRLHFSYWTDPLCIWALVAQEKLDRLLSEWGPCLEIEYHVVPVFGSLPWRFSKGPWAAGGVAARVAATRKVAEQHGWNNVSGEVWARAMPASSWSPGAAIKAVCDLEQRGEIPLGAAADYQWKLRLRFFVEERNVSLRSEQLALAEELGLPRGPIETRLDDGSALASLWEDHQERETQKIQGSPTYVFDGGRAQLYGNFAWGVLHATVDELLRGLEPGCSRC